MESKSWPFARKGILADRTGLQIIVDNYRKANPKLSWAMLWKKIRNDLKKARFFTPCGNYEVKFREDPATGEEYLVQIKNEEIEYPIKFDAFRRM